LASAKFWLAILQRDYHTAGKVAAGGDVPEVDFQGYGFSVPREWMEAMVARGLGDEAEAKANLLAARERTATAVQAEPESGQALIILARIDAALGRKEDAIREGERAAELLPIEKDAVNGPWLQYWLAGLYAETGETGRALALLEKLSRIPAGVTYGFLKLDPMLDPLRREVRFQALLDHFASELKKPAP
jgi:tetratricopeptide (TPR) repeat protein